MVVTSGVGPRERPSSLWGCGLEGEEDNNARLSVFALGPHRNVRPHHRQEAMAPADPGTSSTTSQKQLSFYRLISSGVSRTWKVDRHVLQTSPL